MTWKTKDEFIALLHPDDVEAIAEAEDPAQIVYDLCWMADEAAPLHLPGVLDTAEDRDFWNEVVKGVLEC